jgi:hypothetical protein
MVNASESSPDASRVAAASLFKVDFEETLRYVDIPIPDPPEQERSFKPSTHRLEAVKIMSWLRKKGVTGIYALTVQDSLYMPHGEEAISKCLESFHIEELDWQRPDLSAKPITEACPDLKKLVLYVSGWASLSYWTSQEGHAALSEFPKVRALSSARD